MKSDDSKYNKGNVSYEVHFKNITIIQNYGKFEFMNDTEIWNEINFDDIPSKLGNISYCYI